MYSRYEKLLETEFSIAIRRPTCDKWQSKTLFLAVFDQHSSIVKSVFYCHLSGVYIVGRNKDSTISDSLAVLIPPPPPPHPPRP